jgi:hypothetical protein
VYLSNGQVAEAANHLGLVKSIGCHFHAAHGLHLSVHLQKLWLGDLNVQVRQRAVPGAERIFMELDGEGLRLFDVFL